MINVMYKLIIFTLIFMCGVSYGWVLKLTDSNAILTSTNRVEYNKSIRQWIPPLEIPEVKVPNDYKNRLLN